MGRGLLLKLIPFSAAYGFFLVNYVDLVAYPSSLSTPGYHLWLFILCFAPSIPVLLILGLKGWGLALGMGLTASLMNDLGFCPAAAILFGGSHSFKSDPFTFYSYQLGLHGSEVWWFINLGFTSIPASSYYIAATIYLRIALASLALLKWYRGNVTHDSFKGPPRGAGNHLSTPPLKRALKG